MAALNKVILIGNLTADPQLTHTESGIARGKFCIGINRIYKDNAGENRQDVTFVPIITWGKQAENCANYLAKGRPVAIEGRLRIYSFDNKEGNRICVTEVVAQNVQFLNGSSGRNVPASDDEPERDPVL